MRLDDIAVGLLSWSVKWSFENVFKKFFETFPLVCLG